MPDQPVPRWTPEETTAAVEDVDRLLTTAVIHQLTEDERLEDQGGPEAAKRRFATLPKDLERSRQEVPAYVPESSPPPDPAVLAEARNRVQGIREAVKRSSRSDTQVRGAFGVGLLVDWDDPVSARFALGQIIVGASRYPEAARRAQLKKKDLDAVAQVEEKLRPAPVTPGRPASPAVAARNRLQCEAEALIDAVIAGVALSFSGQPEVLRAFKTALPSRARGAVPKDDTGGSKRPTEPAPAPTEPAAAPTAGN